MNDRLSTVRERIASDDGDGRLPNRRFVVGVLALLVLLALPVGTGPLFLLKMTGAFYFAIFAMSWDVVSGYTGNLSFGHSFIFAVGGYTAALLTLDAQLSPVVSVLVGVLAAIVAGLVIGFPALRLRGPYFAIVTFLLPSALTGLFVLYKGTFGGELGLPSPAYLLDMNGQVATITANYYLALFVFVAMFALLFAVTRSRIGEILTAIRENEDAVASSGINPVKYKLLAFELSAAVGGFGAALFVHTPIGGANPTQLLAVAVSINVLLATILGGIGTIVGPAIGGVVFYLLRDSLDSISWNIPVLGVSFSSLDLILFSIIILVVIYFIPDGIVGGVQQTARRLGGPDEESAMTDGGRSTLERILTRYRRDLEEDWGERNE